MAAQDARDREQLAEYRALVVKAVVSGVLGALTMALSSLPWLLLAMTAFVMVWAGREFYTNGLRALVHGVPNMNSLIAVGTGAAFLYSLVATAWPAVFTRAGVAAEVYYEAVVIIIALVLAGRALEATGPPSDGGRPARARLAAADDRHARWTGRASARWRSKRSRAETCCSSGLVSTFPLTARSWTGPRAWTSRC